ncbi:MAG TPA: LamG domain-containing protein, partial [Flavobacteriales bacterium]|nr:LamG domain-containing protein [Flavobacteriales bacterium]
MTKNYALATIVLLAISPSLLAQTQNALDFDGIDDQVIVSGASTHIAGSAAMSMTAWVYPRNSVNAFPDLDGYAGFRNEVDADFYLVQIYNDVLEGRFRNSAGVAFTATTTTGLSLNTWHSVGLVYDGATLAIWVDGSVAASTAANGMITSTTADFTIGNINYNTQPFWLDGKMDEIALWRRALNATEMECLSAMPPNSGDPDLALYFSCDQGTPGGDNTAIPSLTDLSASAANGTFSNIALTGAGSNFVQGTVFGTQVSDEICPGGSYSFNGQTLTAPGVYTASISTGGLCDSTVVLTLTQTVVNTNVAQNQNLLISQAGGAGYQWINCATN